MDKVPRQNIYFPMNFLDIKALPTAPAWWAEEIIIIIYSANLTAPGCDGRAWLHRQVVAIWK